MGIEVALFSAITAGIGMATSAAGAAKQASISKDIAKNSAKQEQVRQAQMALESRNKKRELIRSAQMAAAQANVNANSAGAGKGSGLSGGLSAINTNAGVGTGNINEAFAYGSQLFNLNAQEAGLKSQSATWGAVNQFGSQLFSSSQQVGQLFGSTPGQDPTGSGNAWGDNMTVFKPMNG